MSRKIYFQMVNNLMYGCMYTAGYCERARFVLTRSAVYGFFLQNLYLFCIGHERSFCEETERSSTYTAETHGETVIIGADTLAEFIYKNHELLTYSHIPNRRTYTFIYFPKYRRLIRVYTFIRFVSNSAYTIFIWSMFISLKIFNIFEVILR